MACCIVTHAALHTGAPAMALVQNLNARLTRSQFLNDMNVPSVTRTAGLSQAEAAAIAAEVGNYERLQQKLSAKRSSALK